MPKPSKVLMYMMLRPLPPSINTLVRRFDPTIGSTMRGYIPGCGIMSGWSWCSKIIENSDHRRYRGTAGSTANTSRWATLRQRRSPYASPPPKIIRHPVVSGNYSVGASCLASFVGFLLRLFGRRLGYEVLQKFALLEFVADDKVVILTRRIHYLLEMVIVVLCRWPERPIRGSDFSFPGACGAIIPPVSVGVLPSVPSLTIGSLTSREIFYFWKIAPTASSPSANLVAMSKRSAAIFGRPHLSSCSRACWW
jgi:hypothetical protein